MVGCKEEQELALCFLKAVEVRWKGRGGEQGNV